MYRRTTFGSFSRYGAAMRHNEMPTVTEFRVVYGERFEAPGVWMWVRGVFVDDVRRLSLAGTEVVPLSHVHRVSFTLTREGQG